MTWITAIAYWLVLDGNMAYASFIVDMTINAGVSITAKSTLPNHIHAKIYVFKKYAK